MRTKLYIPCGQENSYFFRNDHFYSQKVISFRALRADSWFDFLSWFYFCWHGNKKFTKKNVYITFSCNGFEFP